MRDMAQLRLQVGSFHILLFLVWLHLSPFSDIPLLYGSGQLL